MKHRDGLNNVFYILLGQAITLLLGILIPKLFVESLGSETNGLMQTINQVFAYFTLIEAGIGAATTQALYKPVATDDKDKINSILSATNKYYKKIALIYACALVTFAVIMCLVVNTTLNWYVIFGVVIFTGLNSVINFAVQQKYKLLMDVSGKKYITTNTATVITVLNHLIKIVLLMLGCNILVIQMGYFIVNLLQVYVIMKYIKKHYKWIDLKAAPDYSAIAQKNSVLVHQFSTLVFNNTDVLLLTVVMGLSVSSIYTMYKMISNIMFTMLENVSGGMMFILGQTFSIDKEKYKERINVFEVVFQAFGFAVATVIYIFYLPFMKIYTADFDMNYIYPALPILFVIIELLIIVRTASNNTINVSGHFKQTKYRSLTETAINLTASIILVFRMGIEGVLIGTVIALLYRSNDIIFYANKKILQRKPWFTYKVSLMNILTMIILVLISNYIPYSFSGYLSLILEAILTAIVVLAIYVGVACLFFGKQRDQMIKLFKNMIKERKQKAL